MPNNLQRRNHVEVEMTDLLVVMKELEAKIKVTHLMGVLLT